MADENSGKSTILMKIDT